MCRGPLIALAPLIAAGVGAGTAIYSQKKAEEAAEKKAQTDAMLRKESQELGQAQSDAERERQRSQANARALANESASDMQMQGMEAAAEEEKRRLEQEKAMAAANPELEYATKFSPGQGGEGTDSTSNFLVPKIADDSGLVRSAENESAGAGGIVTPLTFAV